MDMLIIASTTIIRFGSEKFNWRDLEIGTDGLHTPAGTTFKLT